MTTAAHVLLPREVVEAICVTLNTLWYRVNMARAVALALIALAADGEGRG